MTPYDQYPPAPHVEDTLRDWINYYHATRGVGHTVTALHGVHSAERARLVVHATVMSKTLVREFKGQNRMILYSRTDHLRGLNVPVVWDNCALTDLFIRSARRIEALKAENDWLERRIEALRQEKSYLQRLAESARGELARLKEKYTRLAESLKRLFGRTH
jgi:hypothetical protein